MMSIVFHYREHKRSQGKTGSIFVRVIYRRRTANITLPYRIYRSEWDDRAKQIDLSQSSGSRFTYLLQVATALEETRKQLIEIARGLSDKEYSVKDIAMAYRCRCGLASFVRVLSMELIAVGRERTARAYRTAVNGFLAFAGKKELQGREITPELVRQFEIFMEKGSKSANTISFYMRNLRAIYNKACNRGIFPFHPVSPFKGVYTGVAVTVKRALLRADVRSMEQLLAKPLDLTPGLLDALHYFLFSFHAQGMCYVDMAYLRKSNLKGKELVYRRKKTGQEIRVPVTPEIRRHLNYFSRRSNQSDYLFPVIIDRNRSSYLQYCNGLNLQNKRLKKLQELLGCSRRLSMHQARHSWATFARYERVADEVISEGLGHRSLATTRIYLDGFDRKVLLAASRKVSRSVSPLFL